MSSYTFHKSHALCLSLFLPLHGYAQQTVAPYTLGEVNVLAQAELKDPDSLVTQQQMVEQGHTNVATAVADIAGVTIMTSARGESMLKVRSFKLRETPVFMDGIPIYDPYEGNAYLGRIATYDLAEIDVAKGFSSSIYGANAMGGAVNLVSRKPQQLFEGEIGGSLTFNDKIQLDGYNSYLNMGTKQKRWYMQLGVSYLDNDAYTLSDDFTPTDEQGSGRLNNSYSTDQKLNVKIGYTPNETDEYSFNYINQQAEKGTAPYVGSDPTYKVKYWQWPEWDKESYYVISKTAFADQQLKIRAYHDIFTQVLESYDSNSYDTQKKGSAFTRDYDDYTNGASLEFTIDHHKLSKTTLIAQYREDVHREQTDDEPQLKFKDHTYTLGIENTTRLSDKVTLISGLSQHWLKGDIAQSYEDDQLGEFLTSDSGITNALFGLYLQQSNVQQWHATFARKSRFPTIKDRYSYKIGAAIPNPDLQAEIANHYEIGLQDVWADRFILGANLYFIDFEDYIQSTDIADDLCSDGSNCSQNINLGSVYNYGTELNLKVDITDDLLFSSNYTWVKQENHANDDLFTHIPEHTALMSLAWDITNDINLLVTERMETGRNSDTDGDRTTASFATTDIRIAYDYKGVANMALKVGNLFDRLYYYQEGMPEPGRTIEISMSRKF